MSRSTVRDQGAMALLFAILLPVVLLGLGAVVVDVGSLYAQRAQTQNGADAGAMAVAQTCAKGSCSRTAAASYAPANSNGTSLVTAQVTTSFPCGGNIPAAVSNGIGGCPAGSETGSICPKPPTDTTVPYVDVLVNTVRSNNAADTLVPDFFGKALLGNSYNGQTVAACAQATWGPVSTCGNCVPFTISDCEWRANTAGGTNFATPYSAANPVYPPSYLATLNGRRSNPIYDTTSGVNSTNYYVAKSIQDPYTPPRSATVAGSETVLDGHGFGDVCKSNSGQNAPGQFGWLGKGGDPCTVSITNGIYNGSTGTPPPSCLTVFQTSRNSQVPVYIPVYGSATGTGSNVQYQLEGFAGFVITGWGNLNSGSGDLKTDPDEPSVVTLADTPLYTQILATDKGNTTKAQKDLTADATYCGAFTGDTGNSTQCIYGYFTQALIPQSALPGGGGGTNLGATTPYLTG